MDRHEACCYSNPNRVCHACFNRDEYKPVALENRPKQIIAIGNECPYCLMNLVFRHNKEAKNGFEDYIWYNFDQFKKDRCEWEHKNRASVYIDTGTYAP